MNNKFNVRFFIYPILILAFMLRLHGFTSPVADWHSWRQADTSAVSRNFVKFGFDLLHPKFDDLSNIPSGVDNPAGYRFVEFPLYNLLQAGFFALFGVLTLEEWGRIVSIFSSLLTIWFLYSLVKKYTDVTTGLFAAFFYALIPYSVYYGRTILPDQMMVMAIMGGIYFFGRYVEESSKIKVQYVYFLISLLFTLSAFLLKPYALFFTLPMAYLAFRQWGAGCIKRGELWLYAFLAILPLIAWRLWMTQFPEGIPASDWLFNGGNIRFKGAFFYWIFADRIGRLILGYWGMILFGLGILFNSKKQFAQLGKLTHVGLFYSFLFSSLLYLIVMARGNVQHDYYQILIVPTLCIFLGLGARHLLIVSNYFNRFVGLTLMAVSTIFMLSFGWYFVRDYYNINNPSIVAAGRVVDRLTPKNAKVIALYNGDTAFLYQTNRQGWPSFEKRLSEMIKMGADYLVLVNPSDLDKSIGKRFKIVAQSPQYLLFDLRKKP